MTYIKLKDSIFEVRRIAGERQIKVDNKWLNHLDFIEHLVNNSKISELDQQILEELAELGYNKLYAKEI